MRQARGESNISEDVADLPHKASRLLNHLRTRGASVVMATPPWSNGTCNSAVLRGPRHKSAQDEREFVFEEILDFCAQGYWAVLPYDAVRHCWADLRLSPLGVVPQRDRRPRLLVDYSHSGVNQDTVPLAPKDSMQFGLAFQRVVTKVVDSDPRYGPVQLAKIDIADGFYRVWLQTRDMQKLGVVLPTSPGQPPLIAFPLVLPMGWVESLPYFTALTETACDLSNNHLRRRSSQRPHSTVHRLEAVAATPPEADTIADVATSEITTASLQRHHPRRPPTAAVDIYVDDFSPVSANPAPENRSVASGTELHRRRLSSPQLYRSATS